MCKTIWIFNQDNTPPKLGPKNRHYYFAYYLKKKGYNPLVFAGSKINNTNVQMIKDKKPFKVYDLGGFPFVFIRISDYAGSKIKRVFSTFQYYFRAMKVAKEFDLPDVIMGSSVHPLAHIAAIRLAKKYNKKCIVEIRDLWPESLIDRGILKKNNPIIKLLYKGEKWIYKKADRLVFTMEGGAQYIKDKGWDDVVDLNKVYHINNGVDLEKFDSDKIDRSIQDFDLENESIFKVVYTGPVRQANNIGFIVDVARILKKQHQRNIKILIWGRGNQKKELEKRIQNEGLDNIEFKGRLDEKHVPYIVSQADMNILHYPDMDIWKYGGSPNKLFEYFAAGKPIISTINMGYDLIKKYDAGIVLDEQDPQKMADAIVVYSKLTKDKKSIYYRNARTAAKNYDFTVLTDKLIDIVEEIS